MTPSPFGYRGLSFLGMGAARLLPRPPLRRNLSIREEVALPSQVHFRHVAPRNLNCPGIPRPEDAFVEEIEMLFPVGAILQPFGAQSDARAELQNLLG